MTKTKIFVIENSVIFVNETKTMTKIQTYDENDD